MVILQNLGMIMSDDLYQNIMQILDIISRFSDHQAYAISQELKGNKVSMF